MKKKHILWVHTIFWMIYLIVPFIPLIFPERQYANSVYIYYVCDAVLNIINFYSCYFAAKPETKQKRKLVQNLLAFVLFIVAFSLIRIYFTYGALLYFDVPAQSIHLRLGAFVQEFLNTLGFSFVPITIRFTLDWFREQHARAELINQNQESEIAFLRSQINPHFLFNTLNNIYALVFKKSDQAPEAVLKLSEIMRYMLYESSTERVSLKREVEYLYSFVELQSLRLADKDFVDFNIHGDIDRVQIAPMLFIPFIENSFKHGSKKTIPGIVINLKVQDNKLTFNVKIGRAHV